MCFDYVCHFMIIIFMVNLLTGIFFLYFSQTLQTPDDGELLVDYSKNIISEDTLNLLFQLVDRII